MCLTRKMVLGCCLAMCFVFMQTGYVLAEGKDAILTKIVGRVEVQTIGEVKWQKAQVGMKLNANQRIRTFENARATLDLGKGTMVIGKESIIDIVELNKSMGTQTTADSTQFKLWIGKIRCEVKKIEKDSKFEIVTPTAIAGIRGTIWDTFVTHDDLSEFYVINGNVWVENLSGAQKYLVLQDQICNVNPTGDVGIPDKATVEQQNEHENEFKETPEVEEPVEPVKKEETPAPVQQKAEKGFGMGGQLGSRMIDGVLYNEIILQPDISIGRFGVGLNILARWNDSEGFRSKDWKEAGNIVRYVRWAEKGAKPVYGRLGTIERARLGNGFIVDCYSNQGTDTSKTKLGSEFDINLKNSGFETIVNDVTDPRLYGGRVYFQPLTMFDINIPILNKLKTGVTYVTDTEPQSGNKEALTVYGADASMPIFGKALGVHADYGRIKNFGQGSAYGLHGGLGVEMIRLDLGYKMEMRNLDSNFVPSIFNPLYEIRRPGTSALTSGGKINGWYGETKIGLAKVIGIAFAMESFKNGNPRVHGEMSIEKQLLHQLSGRDIDISFSYDQQKTAGESLFNFSAKNSVTTQKISYELVNRITLIYTRLMVIDEDGNKIKGSSLSTKMSF